MKKTKKLGKGILLSVLGALAFGTAAATATYALFTSKAEAEINVVAGKVNVEENISLKSTSYLKHINMDGTYADSDVKTLTNDSGKKKLALSFGNASVDENVVSIDKRRPGDKVVLKVDIVNNSTVKIKYCQKMLLAEGTSRDFFNQLKITETSNMHFNTGRWSEASPAAKTIDSFEFTIEMPATATQVENPSLAFSLVTEAVQSNAVTSDYTVKDGVKNIDNLQITGSGSGVIRNEKAGSVLTVEGNGKVTALETNKYAMAVMVSNGGKIVINDGYYTQEVTGTDSQYDLIYAEEGEIEINGGTFKSVTPKWTLNCLDKNYTAGTAKIVVKGGRFYKYDPSNSRTEPDGVAANFVAEGYEVVQDGDYYVVQEKKNHVEIQEGGSLKDVTIVKDALNEIVLPSGEFNLGDAGSKFNGVRIAFQGKGEDSKLVISDSSSYAFDNGANASFADRTLMATGSSNNIGFVRANSLHFDHCTINGLRKNFGSNGAAGQEGSSAVFDGCKFISESDNVYLYAGTHFEFNNCSFSGKKAGIKLFKDVEAPRGVIVDINDCTFVSTNETPYEAGSENDLKYTVISLDNSAGQAPNTLWTVNFNKSTWSGNFGKGIIDGKAGLFGVRNSTYEGNGGPSKTDKVVFNLDGVKQAFTR